MNLYIFNDSCSGARYGIGTYIQELTASIRNSNINICIINLFADVPQVLIEEKNNIKNWYLPKPTQELRTISNEKQRDLYYQNVIYLLQLHIEVKENIVFHLNYNYKSNFPKGLNKAFNCRIVTSVHYLNWCLMLNGNTSAFREKIAVIEVSSNDMQNSIIKSYLKEKVFFESIDQIICLSEYTQNILKYDYRISSNKIKVVYNGLTDIKSYLNKTVLRMKYIIPDVPIMLFTGRIDSRKGLMYAILAFRKVLDIQPNCHFIIVGNGDFDLHMRECEDIWMKITWTGRLDKDKLYDIYSIADIGILPSLTEQCSYVAIEMMMHGIPLIASTSTGLNEMIEDGYNGLQISIEERPDEVEINTSLLAEKIVYLLQNPTERKRMGLNARKQYEKLYKSEIMGKKMLDIYCSILKD